MSKHDTPIVFLTRDPSHGNEFRIGFDPRGTGICDMQDLPDLPDNMANYWYFDEDGSFVYPGRLIHFLRALEKADIPSLESD